jgi:hypothetical protein
MEKKKTAPQPPWLPPAPPRPYSFDDFVATLQQDRVYAHAIHRMVMWGRKHNCEEAMRQLNDHVRMDSVLEDLDVSVDIDAEPTSRCTNNTKFLMLDFSKYV